MLCNYLVVNFQWNIFYKKYYYKIHNVDAPEVNKETIDWNAILRRLGTHALHRQRFDYAEYNDSRYVNVDMYNLIFNKDTDQLLSVYPNFVLSDTQRTLLDLAKKDILYICDVFGLDHNINLLPGEKNDCLKTKQILDIIK